MAKNSIINVKGIEVIIINSNENDFSSNTDIARHKDSLDTDSVIQNWMNNRNTIELLGFWEILYNPDFKSIEFEGC